MIVIEILFIQSVYICTLKVVIQYRCKILKIGRFITFLVKKNFIWRQNGRNSDDYYIAKYFWTGQGTKITIIQEPLVQIEWNKKHKS